MRKARENAPVISTADDPLAVESNTPDEFLMTLQHPEAGPILDVPETNCVVTATTHHQVAVILQARDAPPVPIQCSHKLAACCAPHLSPYTKIYNVNKKSQCIG